VSSVHSVGERLRELRKRAAKTVAEVSRCAGIPASRISEIELGGLSASPRALSAYGHIVGISEDELSHIAAEVAAQEEKVTDISKWVAQGGQVKTGRTVVAKGVDMYRQPRDARLKKKPVIFMSRHMSNKPVDWHQGGR